MDVKRPPLDRPAVRYALSLATNRKAIASLLGAGRSPGTGLVPPMPGYPSRDSLFVSIDGYRTDVLAFDPRAARALLAKEGIRNPSLGLTFPKRTGSMEVALVIQSQWRKHLGVNLILNGQEQTVWERNTIARQYQHMIEEAWAAFYEDPFDYLGPFGIHEDGTTWSDSEFDASLAAANRIPDLPHRIRALRNCEEQLLRNMPVLPIYFDAWAYLQAPYVRGMKANPFGAPRFKYAWIDTNWRPS